MVVASLGASIVQAVAGVVLHNSARGLIRFFRNSFVMLLQRIQLDEEQVSPNVPASLQVLILKPLSSLRDEDTLNEVLAESIHAYL